MSLRMILMRHAKSSWGDPMLDDHARPLNGRGRRSAEAVGRWLKAKNIKPDQLLISSAARTRETAKLLDMDGEQVISAALYHAGPGVMLKILKQATGRNVLILGHNPGISWFARELVMTPPNHPRFADYPTGATLIVDFDIENWRDLKPGTGRVFDFITPREIMA